MVEFLTRMPCRFNGRDYSSGEVVAESEIESKMVGSLISMGFISKLERQEPAELKVPLKSAKKSAKSTKVSSEIEMVDTDKAGAVDIEAGVGDDVFL